LRATLVTAVIASAGLAIALSVGAIGVPAYTKAKGAVRELWQDLSRQVAQTAAAQTLSYFQSAPITVRLIDGLVAEGRLAAEGTDMLLDVCYRTLKENPDFMAVFYATAEGVFYGVYREGGAIVGTHRTVETIRNFRPEGTEWISTGEERSDYDPRKRPFWKTGVEHPSGSWTDPYVFAVTGATGYTYVLAHQEKGEVKGYWGIDFQIDHLSDFLKKLDVGKKGSIYIVANDGKIVASSTKEIDRGIGKAWEQFSKSAGKNEYLNLKQQIYYIEPLPKESQIPWNLATVIHEDDFLLPIRSHALHALYYGLIPCFFFLVLAAAFFGAISRRLKDIAKEMDKVGNLSIDLKEEGGVLSRIREVNMMEQSLYKMKIGLKSFSKYVPLDLVKRLLQTGVPELGGEKKEITAMFADLAQFTTLSEQLKPDEVAKVLELFLDTATNEVHKEKGTIDKFMGDAVMAIWNAPDPHPEHALAACRAALALKKLSDSDPRVKFKIGINTGEAMVGNFGSHERMDYTAIGDTINIASRLEKINKTYNTQILIGPATAKAVEKTLLVRPVDWIVLQGRTKPILIHELLDEKGSDALIQAAAAYSAGMEAYLARRFSEASSLFEKANGLLGGGDVPSKILLAKSRSFEKHPPPPNWNGTALIEGIANL
jgi:adenylate cyclase